MEVTVYSSEQNNMNEINAVGLNKIANVQLF